MGILEIEKTLADARKRLSEEIKRHEKNKRLIDGEIANLVRLQGIALNGLDMEMVAIAENLIRVGIVNSLRRESAVEDAIRHIHSTATPMSKEYVGVKVYSGFGEQGSNHPYGYGPAHGSIVFRIESLVCDREWTDAERSAAIYYLRNIKRIQKAGQEAA